MGINGSIMMDKPTCSFSYHGHLGLNQRRWVRDLFIVKASKDISLNVIGISYFEEVVVTLSAENE